jgi:hypothetical protein
VDLAAPWQEIESQLLELLSPNPTRPSDTLPKYDS